MNLDTFKKIIDELEGNVESITLASRGEPTVHPDFNNMLDYMKGKFLAVKVNTNASLLNDEKIHAILSSEVQTIVFSIDAADKNLYEKLRVNGKFEQTLNNIKRFNKIKQEEYPHSRIVTRISGVKVNEEFQGIDNMTNFWSSYADIIAFTNYNPWEDSYTNEINDIDLPCTDLWTRLFVWWDGKINPCDYDYKSELSRWNFEKTSVSDAWNSLRYNDMRVKHLNKQRNEFSPCNRCINV